MLKIITDEIPQDALQVMYDTYYKFFLHIDGFLVDKLFKNSPKNPIKKSTIQALDSIHNENTSFYLYYLNDELLSFGRLHYHNNILHLGEMLFTEEDDKYLIMQLIIEELEIYAASKGYETLEIEIPKSNNELISLALAQGYNFVKENPETVALFKTYVLYKDIYERTNSSKQR